MSENIALLRGQLWRGGIRKNASLLDIDSWYATLHDYSDSWVCNIQVKAANSTSHKGAVFPVAPDVETADAKSARIGENDV